MSDPHAAAHGAPTAAPFSQEELHEFQESDIAVGRVVVLLMAGIFLIGLLLYSAVAYIVDTAH